MSSAINYADALHQLEAAGLLIHDGGFEIGRMRRCKVDGMRGKPGWYAVHEIQLHGGDWLLVGSYGIWHGDEKNAQKIQTRRGLTDKEEAKAINKMLAESRRKADAEYKRLAAKAAHRATEYWKKLSPSGSSDYLERKNVQGHGVRFTEKGAIAVPMCDANGNIWGLQVILSRSGYADRIKATKMEKENWPRGMMMRGHFHTLGSPRPGGIILVAEGYATASTLFEASGYPVLCTFTANNLLPAAEEFARRFKHCKFLFCADDDHVQKCKNCKKYTTVAEPECTECGQPHGKGNAGVNRSTSAAAAMGGYWTKPAFSDERPVDRKSLTDFNDLSVAEGLHVVREQIQRALDVTGLADDRASARGTENRGAGDSCTPFYMTIDDAVDRYSLIYGVKDTMFDHDMFKLVPKSCVLDVTPDRAWGDIKRHPGLRVYDIDEVGFDPGGTDKQIKCNLWSGWPTQPDSRGKCDRLLELLEYICSSEGKSRDLSLWVLRWLAYPIQNHGAKMKTALVVHGPTRVGKNLFFESVMHIYGKYGQIVGQDALEDTFNDWLSGKLFLLANEVVARQELFHQKNKLKGIITDDKVRIRAPFMGSRWERNHMNIVFMANEDQPVVPDPDDERFAVIWTPKRKDKDYYGAVLKEIADGGIEALHHYLLNLDLGDFHPGTPPPMTKAKERLVDLSKDSVQRFFEAWRDELTPWPYQDCLKSDLYDAYRRWCTTEGERFPRTNIQFATTMHRFSEHVEITVKPVYAGMEKALKDAASEKALEFKSQRIYIVHAAHEDGEKDVVKVRTSMVVKFGKALRGNDEPF